MSADTAIEPNPDLDTMKRADLPVIWESFQTQAEKLMATAATIVVTDVSQVAEMKLARATRLSLRSLRTTIEGKRVELGEHHLRETQKINGAAKKLRDLIEPLEDRLKLMENFAEIETSRKKAELKLAREMEIFPFVANLASYNFAEMTEPEYQHLLTASKAANEALQLAAAQAAKEQTERDQAAALLHAQTVLENDRLRKEAVAAEMERQAVARAAADALKAQQAQWDAEFKAERARQQAETARLAKIADAERAEAKRLADIAAAQLAEQQEVAAEVARIEREAREAAEAELARQQAATAKIESDRLAAERAAAMAPEREKLMVFAALVRALQMPILTTSEGISVIQEIAQNTLQFADWIEQQAETL